MSTTTAPPDASLDLYTLDDITARTGLAPAVLRRLAGRHAASLPTAGDDPLRRYPSAAVEAFRRLAREEEGDAAAHRRPLLSLAAQLRGARRRPEGGREVPPMSQSAEVASVVASAKGGLRLPTPVPTAVAASPTTASTRDLTATAVAERVGPAAAAAEPPRSEPAPATPPVSELSSGPRRAAPARRPRRGPSASAAPAVPVAGTPSPARVPAAAAEVTVRLAAIEASQRRLEAEIRAALAALREPLSGSVAEI